jgi:aryl-alcohol dehydrogenase-like predicted oxidoreductase
MEQRNLGRSGLRVSSVGLGCNSFAARIDLAATRAVVSAALDLGVTLFDTADFYGNRGGSEEYLGAALGSHRKDVVLATKFGLPMGEGRQGASRRYIMQAVEDSLRRLGTEWIDLYQLHTPDPLTPIQETLEALDQLVRSGKVRYIGCSNLAAWQMVDAQWTARDRGLTGFVSCQDEYSLLVRGIERELLPAMAAHGLGLLPYLPLAAGLLTGRYRKADDVPQGSRMRQRPEVAARLLTAANWRKVDHLAAFAAARDRSLLEIAFGWLAAQPGVASIIAGASSPGQVAANVGAMSWRPSVEETDEINRIVARADADDVSRG